MTHGDLKTAMNEEAFNLSTRKFFKTVGVNSQREIEHAVARALADGAIAGTETLGATVTLENPAQGFSVNFSGDIAPDWPAHIEALRRDGCQRMQATVVATHSESAT